MAVMKAQDMAPVAWALIVASALGKGLGCQHQHAYQLGATGETLRGLIISASRPHNDVGRRRAHRLCHLGGTVTLVGRLGEAKDGARHAADIAPRVGSQGAEKTLARLLGQVGLLEDAFCGVDVGQVHGRGRVARVENGRQSDAGAEGPDDEGVDLVVDDVTVLLVVDGVHHLVESVVFVTVQVLGLAAVACGRERPGRIYVCQWRTYQSSGEIGRRWAGRP